MKLTIILTTIGAAAGFAYASVLGCDTVCSVASSSLNTTVYGAFAGLVLAFPINKNSKITFSMIGYKTIMLPIFEIQDFVYLEKESIPLDVVDVIGKSKNSKKKFNRIERDVRKVYPYAKKTSELLNDYSSIIDSLEQYSGIKRYVRKRKIFSKIEDELILKYGHSIKKLKRRQGRILIRLIDRETGRTSYDIIKDFRNFFSASFWQLTAKVFGHDLQSVFGQGKKEDIFIEYVIKKIENEKLYN